MGSIFGHPYPSVVQKLVVSSSLSYLHGQIKTSHFLEENGVGWMAWKRNLPLSCSMGVALKCQIQSARAILNSLLKTHGSSWRKEWKLTEGVLANSVVFKILNSHLLTRNVMKDVTCLAPLSLIKLPSIKSNSVMLTAGSFTSPDWYCQKYWRKFQNLPNKFSNQWRKEVIQTLQNPKWNGKINGIPKKDTAKLEILSYKGRFRT